MNSARTQIIYHLGLLPEQGCHSDLSSKTMKDGSIRMFKNTRLKESGVLLTLMTATTFQVLKWPRYCIYIKSSLIIKIGIAHFVNNIPDISVVA